MRPSCLLLFAVVPACSAALSAETYVVDGAGDPHVNGYYIKKAAGGAGFVKRTKAEPPTYVKLLDSNRTLQYVDVGGGNMYWLVQHADAWLYAQLAEEGPSKVPPTGWQVMGGNIIEEKMIEHLLILVTFLSERTST
jgi:hypothetical protein